MAGIPPSIRFFAALIVALTFALSSRLEADEIVIDDYGTIFNVGDFKCSGCPTQITNSMGLFGKENPGQIPAGQLWQFFHDQGVNSLDRITLCLDIDQLDRQTAFDLHSMQLKIEDPAGEGRMLTNVSLGENLVRVRGQHTSAFKPEAKLEVLLDYDFMERFSADSTELVTLDFTSNSELINSATISIEGSGNVFTRFNSLLMLGFVAFWLVVFFVLNRVTKPMTEIATAKQVGAGSISSPIADTAHTSSMMR